MNDLKDILQRGLNLLETENHVEVNIIKFINQNKLSDKLKNCANDFIMTNDGAIYVDFLFDLIKNNYQFCFHQLTKKVISKYDTCQHLFNHLNYFANESKINKLVDILKIINEKSNIDIKIINQMILKLIKSNSNVKLFDIICENNLINIATGLSKKFSQIYFVEIENDKIIDFTSCYHVNHIDIYRITEFKNEMTNKEWWLLGFTLNNDEIECSICLNETNNNLKTSCKHTFCKKCIFKWLKTNNTCPICRNSVCEFDISFESNIMNIKKHMLIIDENIHKFTTLYYYNTPITTTFFLNYVRENYVGSERIQARSLF